MSTPVTISVKTGRLPSGTEFTPAEYRPLLLQRLKLSLSDSNSSTTVRNILLGTSDAGSYTPSNIGPVFKPEDGSWWVWSESTGAYIPAEFGFITGNFGMTINAAPTAARTITLHEDPTASISYAALLSDVSIPKPTIMLTSSSGTVSAIDADKSKTFILELKENVTMPAISNLGVGSGKRIRIAIMNNGTSYTVTWPTGTGAVQWPGSVTPVQPVKSDARPMALAIYTIYECNSGVGVTPHLWGDPEITGFASPTTAIDDGSSLPSAYLDDYIPPPKDERPYDRP